MKLLVRGAGKRPAARSRRSRSFAVSAWTWRWPICRSSAPPLSTRPPWSVLSRGRRRPGWRGRNRASKTFLERALTDGLITDAALAQSEAQAQAFWALREGQSAAQKSEGVAWKHDVAVPVSRVADFIADTGAALEARFPGVRIDAFGHVGDGNIHYDVRWSPVGGDQTAHAAARNAGPASSTTSSPPWAARSAPSMAWGR